MQLPAQARQRGSGLAYKWIVAIVVIFGIFMSILDSTIVNIAIPRLQTAFGANLNSVQWVATAYILAQGVATPLTPFFSQRLGLKRFYLTALGLFTIGSALCGLAWSLPVLIFFRVLQGAGGACLLPLSITLLYREFPPEERGTVTGALGIPILLAPALGPTVGGYIVTFAGWPLIFYINVPIGILAVILGLILLRDYEREGRAVRFDIPGFIFAVIGLTSILYAFSDASTDGWGSSRVISFLAIGILGLIAFVVTELVVANRGGQPLLDLRLFANGPFATGNIGTVLVTFVLLGGLFLVPIYLQNVRGLSAYQAGLLLLPQALGSMVAVLVGGRLVDRIGVKLVVLPGLVILAIALWRFSYLSLTTPYWEFQILLILRGLGLGLCAQPLTVAALSDIGPRDLPQATSVSTVTRSVAGSLGVAVLATLVQTQTKVHYSHLAEQVTAVSPLAVLVRQLEAAFVAHGASMQAATTTAIQLVYRNILLQGYVLGIGDAFLLSLAFAVVAFIAVLFLRQRRRPRVVAQTQIPAEPASTPAPDAARDEELLAV